MPTSHTPRPDLVARTVAGARDARAAIQYANHQAALAARAREIAQQGIQCPLCHLAYGSLWAEHPGGRQLLCSGCIEAENARWAAERPAAYADRPACYPVPGGVPKGARYLVRLSNASGRGSQTYSCATPADAQFTAMTVRPYNNTRAEISVDPDPRPCS